MVNQGPNTNASQFFFTLTSTPELDKKNTLFGKVVGNTVFNMLKLGEGEIIGETPVHMHKIIKADVRSIDLLNQCSTRTLHVCV
jgi:peptidyl-prolyl cis-trans isomerase SDCCAG10